MLPDLFRTSTTRRTRSSPRSFGVGDLQATDDIAVGAGEATRRTDDTGTVRHGLPHGSRLAAGAFAVVASCCAAYGIAAAAPVSEATRSSSSVSREAPPFRYIYNSASAARAVVSSGWNLVDVGSQASADSLPNGARGLVWVGDYDNSTCSWELRDSALAAKVAAAVGDRKVFGYFFSDEPNPYVCQAAPAQHRARSKLIHSVDPKKPTVIVLDSNGFKGRASGDALNQLPLWKGTADYVGLDPYPCYRGAACDFSWIDRTIRAADAARLNYWGVVQAFADSSWRWPTEHELSQMLERWAASRETGYMTFAWTWAGKNLSEQPHLLDVFERFNGLAARPKCVVPALLGSTLAAARAALARAGCAAGRIAARYSSRRRGRVVAQRPAPKTRLARGGRVDLVISRGRRPTGSSAQAG